MRKIPLNQQCRANDVCLDSEASCRNNVCLCTTSHFEKNGRCVPKVLLNRGCEPSVDVCLDGNAVCRGGICLCEPVYFEKNAVCGKLKHATHLLHVSCDGEIYKNVTSLTERRVALNEACASRSDVCIDEFATCVTGTCKCIDNYHEKLGQCCECHQRRRRARACYVIITETSIPVTMVPRAVLWARLRLCSSRLQCLRLFMLDCVTLNGQL